MKFLYNKIKESFESMNRSAPDDLWGNLSDRMDLSDTDRSIDERVKEGFKNLDETAPEHVWGGVNRQLNIDRVWNRISSAMDRRHLLYWRRMAGMAAMLLFLLGWGGYRYLLDTQKPVIAALEDNNSSENENRADEKQINSAKGGSLPVRQAGASDGKNDYTENIIENNNNLTERNTNLEGNNKTFDESNSTKDQSNKRVENYASPHDSNNNNASTSNTNNAEFYTIQKDEIVTPLINDFIIELIPIRPVLVLAENDENKELSLILLNDYYSDALVEKKSHFEIGLIYSYNNTWIFNNETRESFDENSLVQTVPTYASSYGLVVNYNFSGKSALSAEFYIHARVKQDYSVYIEGKYYDKEIELNYSKITLLYQRNIQQHMRIIPSKYTIKAGWYFAYLKNKFRYHNDDIVSINDDYTDLDYGIKLAIGQEKDIRKFILGYGINSEYGLKNIFRGNERMDADFDNTKIARIGAYLIIKYKL